LFTVALNQTLQYFEKKKSGRKEAAKDGGDFVFEWRIYWWFVHSGGGSGASNGVYGHAEQKSIPFFTS
jgi:hypothetical protein